MYILHLALETKTALCCSSAVLDPRVGHTMNILSPFISVLCHSDWLFHSESCPSRLCVVFLACVHLALFLALSLSPGNSRVSSWCDHSMIATLLWQSLTVLSLLQLCWRRTHLFSSLSTKLTHLPQSFHLRGVNMSFFILQVSSFHSRTLLQAIHTSAFISRILRLDFRTYVITTINQSINQSILTFNPMRAMLTVA